MTPEVWGPYSGHVSSISRKISNTFSKNKSKMESPGFPKGDHNPGPDITGQIPSNTPSDVKKVASAPIEL